MGKSSQIRVNSASSKITPSIRYIVSEWIYRVAEKLYGRGDTARRVFHSSILTFDLALFSTPVDKFPFPLAGSNLQLTALASIIYSTRHLHEQKKLHRIPAPDKILAVCNSNFTLSQLFALCNVLDQVQPLKNHSTVMEYLDNLPQSLDIPSSLQPFLSFPLSESVRKYIFVLVDTFFMDFPSIKYSSSVILLASIVLAQEMVSKKRFMKERMSTLPPFLGECYCDVFASAKKLFSSKLNQTNQPVSSPTDTSPSTQTSNELEPSPSHQTQEESEFKQTEQTVLSSPKSGIKRKRFEQEEEEEEEDKTEPKKRKILTFFSLQT